MVVGQPAQQLDRVGDVLVRHRQLRRAASSSASASARGAHLRPVLDRLAHVGEHPLQLVAQLLDARRRRGSRSISIRIQLSTSVAGDRRRRARRRRQTSISLPSGSRRTTTSGWTSRCDVEAGAAISGAVTESTRNGMSSVTISTDRVRLVGVRLATASFSSPGSRCAASSRCARAAASISAAVWPTSSSSGASRQYRLTRSAQSARSRAGQRDRLGDQALGVGHGLAPRRRRRRSAPDRGRADRSPAGRRRRSELDRLRIATSVRPAGRQPSVPLPSTHHAVGSTSAAQPRTSRAVARTCHGSRGVACDRGCRRRISPRESSTGRVLTRLTVGDGARRRVRTVAGVRIVRPADAPYHRPTGGAAAAPSPPCRCCSAGSGRLLGATARQRRLDASCRLAAAATSTASASSTPTAASVSGADVADADQGRSPATWRRPGHADASRRAAGQEDIATATGQGRLDAARRGRWTYRPPSG